MRWATFAAILTIGGSVVFQSRVVSTRGLARGVAGRVFRRAARMANRWAWWAAVLLLPLAFWRLYSQVSAFVMPDEPVGPVVRALLTQTAWGRGWWLQIAATVLALVVFCRPRHPRNGHWWPRVTAAALLALAPAFAGHAGTDQSNLIVSVGADWIHVAAAGAWLGCMFLLVSTGIPAVFRFGGGAPMAAVMIQRFSPVALLSAGTLVATGVVSSWLRLTTLSDLWRSGYGILLLIKIVWVLVMAGVGAYNWKRMTPRVTDDAALPFALRSIAREVTIGIVILLVTAVLVATPFPAEGAE